MLTEEEVQELIEENKDRVYAAADALLPEGWRDQVEAGTAKVVFDVKSMAKEDGHTKVRVLPRLVPVRLSRSN